jgi:hypothetical protein
LPAFSTGGDGWVCILLRSVGVPLPSPRALIMNIKKWVAELIGTFWLTFAGCGSAVLAAGFPKVGIGSTASRSPSGSPS